MLAVPWGLALAAATLSFWLGSENFLANVSNLLFLLTFGIVGTLIVLQQPRNPVGWPFLGEFIYVTLYDLFNHAIQVSLNLPDEVAVYTDSFVAFLDAYLNGPVSTAIWGTLFLFPVLYFPDGNLVSPRWRYVVGVILIQLFALLVVGVFYPGLESPLFPDFQNPLSRSIATSLWNAVNGTFLITFILASLSLVIRFRKATGVERQQIKWPFFRHRSSLSR